MNISIPRVVHRHYKGGRYLVTDVAETYNHNGDLDVVYVVLSTGKTCTRPVKQDSRKEDAWTDEVRWPDGRTRKRFVPEGSFEAPVLRALCELWEAPCLTK